MTSIVINKLSKYIPLDNGRNSGKKLIQADKITNGKVDLSGLKIHILKGR